MFAAVMMPPSLGGLSTPTALSSPFRPTRPSPLSSSPVRATSPSAAMWRPASPVPSSPPLCASSPVRPSSPSLSRRTPAGSQSSPVQPASLSATASTPIPGLLTRHLPTHDAAKNPFRFASRQAKAPPRPSRDASRQTRHALFLRNVRQRADDRAWDRRNCEDEIQKLEWWSLQREIREAREADELGMLTEHDFDEAAAWTEQLPASSSPLDAHARYYEMDDDRDDLDADADERMAELRAQEEEAELEALIASMDGASAPSGQRAMSSRPPSPQLAAFSDDEDYDAIFSELLSHAPPPQALPVSMDGDIDMA